MKRKKFTKVLTPEDWLDVTLEIEKKRIHRFALNYRALIGNNWEEVYRVDNFHGFLHEQKFWRSPKPVPIKDERKQTLNKIFDDNLKKIITNFQKYRTYFEDKEKKNEKTTNKKRTKKESTRSETNSKRYCKRNS